MAKTQKYSDDLMLEAVNQYAEACDGKIKATNLAAWARENVPGLEDVKEYMFLRKVKGCDDNGNPVMKNRPCTDRINEINDSRKADAATYTNPLLMASNIDALLDLPRSEQRKYVLDTREQMDRLTAKAIRCEQEKKSTEAENARLRHNEEQLNEKIKSIKERQESLEKIAHKIVQIVDEQKRAEALALIGISDFDFDLEKNVKALTIDVRDTALSIGRNIRAYEKASGGIFDELSEGMDW